MAQVSIVVEEDLDAYATWSHVFQGANTTWLFFDTRQIIGNFFNGLQAQTCNFWDAQIPPGSTILSATMDVVAFQNSNAAAYTTRMTAQRRSTDSHSLLPVQMPFESFTGWRPDRWSNLDIDINSNTGLGIAETSGGVSNAAWTVKQLPTGQLGWRAELAQGITWPAATNGTVGSMVLQMIRKGNPEGSGRLLIQGSITNRGQLEPDGVTLATSNDVLMSTLSTSISPVTFIFSGADQITPVVGTDYFIIFDSDFVGNNNLDNVSIRHQNAFFSQGRALHYGGDTGLGWQNYPGQVELNVMHTLGTNFLADIPWLVPRFFTGVTYTSPDITPLIQAQIDDPGYVVDAGVMVACNRGLPTTINRVWCSNNHASNAGPILRVTYEEPEEEVNGGGKKRNPRKRRVLHLKTASLDTEELTTELKDMVTTGLTKVVENLEIPDGVELEVEAPILPVLNMMDPDKNVEQINHQIEKELLELFRAKDQRELDTKIELFRKQVKDFDSLPEEILIMMALTG